MSDCNCLKLLERELDPAKHPFSDVAICLTIRDAVRAALIAAVEALERAHDTLIERSVGAMAIAEGEVGYEKIVIDCPMLFAVSELRFKYNAEHTKLETLMCGQASNDAAKERK